MQETRLREGGFLQYLSINTEGVPQKYWRGRSSMSFCCLMISSASFLMVGYLPVKIDYVLVPGAVLSIIRVTSSNVRAQPLSRTTHCPHIKHFQLSCNTIFLIYVCGLRFVCPGPLAGSIGPSSHLPVRSIACKSYTYCAREPLRVPTSDLEHVPFELNVQ